MVAITGIFFCFAFILGLIASEVSGTVRSIPLGSLTLLICGIVLSFLIPRFHRKTVRPWVWLCASIIAFLAGIYFQWRLPHPGAIDISRLLTNSLEPSSEQTFTQVTVTGKIATAPRLTQSQRIQFELNATQVQRNSTETRVTGKPVAGKPVTGKVYVTVPLLQGTGLYPGQTIAITGSLYLPKPSANPGSFDFAQYLAQRGIFSGLNGTSIDRTQNRTSPPLLWSIRQKIIRAQVNGAGVPEGVLLSAMVMGGRSVDVPYSVRETFRTVGLSHLLAASGAHVALLLGVVMALTRRSSVRWQVSLGLGTLLLFVGLAGLQPSVLRAALMGAAALVATLLERRTKPFNVLLVTATLLLIVNPIWIRDIGFQLSFLATLGLLITVPVLNQWLDWLPKALIPWFAVPIAAHLWTLPLLLYIFGVVSPFSILINILASPLFTIVSLGGMVSGIAALIYPEAGQFIASGLYYPAHSLIRLAEWGSHLPGSSLAVGTISALQLAGLYGLIILVWQWNRSRRFWWVALLVGFSLVAVPVGYAAMTRFQITVMATSNAPMMVIQDRGNTTLIYTGQTSPGKINTEQASVQYSLLPFLKSQGINQIHQTITFTPTSGEGWQQIMTTLSLQTVYTPAEPAIQAVAATHPASHATSNLSHSTSAPPSHQPLFSSQPIAIGSATTTLIHAQPPILTLQTKEQTWLLLGNISAIEASADSTLTERLPKAEVLWWSGSTLSLAILEAVQPTVAIVNARSLSPQTQTWLQAHAVNTFVTGQTGAVQWTPAHGFRTVLPADTAD
jgi:competence protein ComEC